MPAKKTRVVGRAKLTSKGQCTLPKSVREELGLKPGDKIDFYMDQDGFIAVRKVIAGDPLQKWSGFLKNPEGLTTDEWIREMRGDIGPDEDSAAQTPSK